MKRIFNHVRFLLPYTLLLVTLAGIIAGGLWMWSGMVLLAFMASAGDELLPSDSGAPQDYCVPVLDALLFGTLPLIVAIYAALIWQIAAPEDLAVSAVAMQEKFGWAKQAFPGWLALTGGILSVSFMVGIAAINVAHELMHRRSKLAVMFGKLLLFFSLDVPLVISHVYGHHVVVGTREDHTTARRGESVYAFIWRSTVSGNLSVWRLESVRLLDQGRSRFSWRNRFLRGHIGALTLVGAAWYWGGWIGVALFLVCAVMSKSILEIINYIQHYGIVRVPGSPIAFRHSWNSDKFISTYLLFSLTRHSHHHAEPTAPFWSLCSYPDSPFLPRGYMTSIFIALLPPVWHLYMVAPLLDWDLHFATPDERVIASLENRSSGVRQLIAANDLN